MLNLGTATENFLKRWLAFSIGAIVALTVELTVFPTKARSRLVDCVASTLCQIHEMETAIATHLDDGNKYDAISPELLRHFNKASSKANASLRGAETFLSFCSLEPRLKGSFDGQFIIYKEIIFVLHQIVDRMDNMLQLRHAYGAGPLEEFNTELAPYRRNVAAAITLTVLATYGALTLKLPLPQFLPSARLAHLRMINCVRTVVVTKIRQQEDSKEQAAKLLRQQAVKRKYLSWNATSAAQAEIIEFIEELADLAKLVVGVNEFRSGLLLRSTYQQYATEEENSNAVSEKDGEPAALPVRRRRTTTIGSAADLENVPASLRRIQSRKHDADKKT